MLLKALIITHPPDYANAAIASRVASALGIDVSWCIDAGSSQGASRDEIPEFVKVIETPVSPNGNLNGPEWTLEQLRIMNEECIGYDWLIKLDSDSIISSLDWLEWAEAHHWLVGMFWPYDDAAPGSIGNLYGQCYAINQQGLSYLLNSNEINDQAEKAGENYLIGTFIPEDHILKHSFNDRKSMMSGWRWDTIREASYWLKRYDVITVHRPRETEKSIDVVRLEVHQIMLWLEKSINGDDGSPPPITIPANDLQTLQTVKPPSLLKMAGTLVKAAAAETKAVITKEPPISEEEYVRRLRLCGTCDLYEKEAGRCSSCGCYMIYKARMRSQSCPLGKW